MLISIFCEQNESLNFLPIKILTILCINFAETKKINIFGVDNLDDVFLLNQLEISFFFFFKMMKLYISPHL